MRKFLPILFALLFLIAAAYVQGQLCKSQDECQKLIGEYEGRLSSLREQKNTLSSQIQFMDTQIYLTTLRIQDTENKIETTGKEIENLSGRIEGLNTSLDYLGKLLIKKIAERYKRRDIPLITLFLDSNNAATLVNRLKYAKIAEENDQRVAIRLQQAKLNFEEQKDLREKKKAELDKLKINLDAQKVDLDNQKGAKQQLLAQTSNDERTYQNLLAQARAEFAAIQGIIAGGGTETELRDVHKGDTIASILPGSSCNSTGKHLHFTVLEGGAVNNPFNYLKSVDHTDYSGGDAWTPSGSWDWPLSPPIEFNQGYGETNCVKYGFCGQIYQSHNGIDIFGSSYNAFAVADGKLYRGSYSVGCTLPYTKVTHKDSNVITLYLHTVTQ